MLKSIKALIGISQKGDATAAEIETALAGARAEIVAAETAHGEADAAYRDGLLRLDEIALEQLIADKTSATVRRDRATALVAALSERLEQAQAAEETARRWQNHRAAEQAVAATARRIEVEYAKHAAALVELLRLIAEADALAHAANAALPAGAEHVSGVEARIRREANVPGRAIASEVFSAWCWQSGHRLAPEQEMDVTAHAEGRTGVWKGSGATPEPVELRRFRRITTVPEVTGRGIASLAATLNLPGLRASHLPFWKADEFASSSSVLAAIEAAKPNWGRSVGPTVLYEPEPVVEVVPLDEPVAAAA